MWSSRGNGFGGRAAGGSATVDQPDIRGLGAARLASVGSCLCPASRVAPRGAPRGDARILLSGARPAASSQPARSAARWRSPRRSRPAREPRWRRSCWSAWHARSGAASACAGAAAPARRVGHDLGRLTGLPAPDGQSAPAGVAGYGPPRSAEPHAQSVAVRPDTLKEGDVSEYVQTKDWCQSKKWIRASGSPARITTRAMLGRGSCGRGALAVPGFSQRTGIPPGSCPR